MKLEEVCVGDVVNNLEYTGERAVEVLQIGGRDPSRKTTNMAPDHYVWCMYTRDRCLYSNPKELTLVHKVGLPLSITSVTVGMQVRALPGAIVFSELRTGILAVLGVGSTSPEGGTGWDPNSVWVWPIDKPSEGRLMWIWPWEIYAVGEPDC